MCLCYKFRSVVQLSSIPSFLVVFDPFLQHFYALLTACRKQFADMRDYSATAIMAAFMAANSTAFTTCTRHPRV